ncbi:Eukaryotic translation initiation factor 4 gamma [Escovopsis weberi]|uniref:Eukaryotic translation initiation factor 4 gamma n=1 Tax=Escovopsis weberi TaxID=150374 RepID=A0A0M8MUK0_ESCWE|nr:Eukaryotic translation initiation factor 4 gamma [Escovopsis weberi]
MATNGPSGYVANGASIAGAKSGIRFGYDSPAMAHSTPQTGHTAPIPIPGGNQRVPSPAHSPSPIPQPSASGGRPPAGLQQPGGQMTFGSLTSEGDPNSHFRRESNHSIHNENQGGPIRGNFNAGRQQNRNGFNPHANQFSNTMGYPPNTSYRATGAGQARTIPPPFQPQPRNIQYPNSPQPNRSPALVSSMPGTPNMTPASMQPAMSMQNPNFHYPPPMAPQHQQNFGFPPPQMDAYGRPISFGGYGNVPYMPPPQTNTPAYGQQFVAPAFHSGPHAMARTPSQPERPSSASQPNQPVICQSNPQAQTAQAKPSNSFVKPRKSAAIQIKNAAGEVVDTSSFKQPVSPAPASHQVRSPPVASTPTPPHKPSTPAHARSESQATPKTRKEIQDELKAKIMQATQAANNKEEEKKEEAAPEAEAPKPAAQPEVQVEEQKEPETQPEPPVVVEDNSKAAETEEPKAVVAAPVVEEKAPAPVEVAAEEKEPVQATEPAKAAEQEKPTEKPAEQSAASADPDEDEIERMIREMEEADARREKEEEEHRKKKEIEKAAAKKFEEENRKKNAEEEDAKLREQEREMERLEEEKERRQREAEASGKTLSVADALAKARGGDIGGKDDSSNVDSVADQLADMSVGDKDAASREKRTPKPAALNLAPINTKPVEPPQPSAALQSLQSARFLTVMDQDVYPAGIKSPNPALNAAVTSKGRHYKYDAAFLLQFKGVFTEQPSLQFSHTIKNLLGDGDGGRSASRGQTPTARQGSRGGGFPGGPFGGPPGGRTLPPGTTSMERMAISSGALPRPPVNPMASFQRPGGPFPTATPMSRTSSQNLRSMPHSPRANSRSTRGSRRNDINAKEIQAAKTMPLTAGQEVKPIAMTANGWKASSLTAKAGSQSAQSASGYLDPEMVQRKVKAALNKMTPENFDRIADQILLIASQSKDESDGRTLRQVIQLTFEKATDEAHWASMYAKFCKRMLETMSPDIRDERIKDKNGNTVCGGNLFRKYLLNRCQEDFERGWTTNLPEPKEAEEGETKSSGEAAMLTDEYYAAAAAKRRGLGLVQFIGELFKLGMLTERIMHECVHKLVDYKGVPDEAEIESLCKLLRTIGANLDQTDKCRPMMDAYFSRIQTMAELPELQSRMKFMLMDVIDLRRARWVSKEANKGPKTLDEVRAEAEAQQAAKAQEAAKSNQRGGSGRPPAGRGDVRNFSAGYGQQTSNQVGMDDLRRLKGSVARTSSQNITLGPGPTSMFASRSNSGRRLGPGGSLGRPGDESNPTSRSGTPGPSHFNTFSLLASTDDHHPGSPPSAGPSPLMAKAVPASDKDNE